jgi:glucosamine--fructose-6-phosphate aminotransferase (isomerizing)
MPMPVSVPNQLEREIRQQSSCLARLLKAERGTAEHIAAAVRRLRPAFAVTAARGSSDNAARYAKYLFGGHNRLVVSLGAPSLITLYGRAPSFRGSLVIGISQSGESPDIVALVAEGRRQGALTVAMTNRTRSPIATAAEHVFPLHAGPERAIAASKSFTCQLMALAMLSAAIEENPDRWRDLERLPEAVERTLSLHRRSQMATVVAALSPTRSRTARAARSRLQTETAAADRMIVIGRGYNLATAFEVALKIKEIASVMAEPYATPDLFHGPLAMVDAGFPALVIAPSGATLADMQPVLDVLASRRAHVIASSDDEALLAHPGVRARLPLPAGVPEWLSPVTAVIPGQLLALALAEARGLDPDRPRGLTKVTRTR